MKVIRSFISFLLILVLVILCIATNPAKKQYAFWLDQNYTHMHTKNKLAITDVFSKLTIDAIVTYHTTSKDCLLFTLYTTEINGQELKTIGIFNHFIPLTPFPILEIK